MRSAKLSLPVQYVLAALLCAGAIAPPSLNAQIQDGSIVGSVLDSTGGRVAAAEIAVVEFGTSLERHAIANSVGEFRIENLRPGKYRVRVNARGFAEAQ